MAAAREINKIIEMSIPDNSRNNGDDVVATFNCGWEMSSEIIYEIFFNKILFEDGFFRADVKTSEFFDLSLGFYDEKTKQPITIKINFCTVNGNVVGIFYPTSQLFSELICKERLLKMYPDAKYSDSSHIFHNIPELKSENKTKDGKVIGFISCGSEIGLNFRIDWLGGKFDKLGKYHDCDRKDGLGGIVFYANREDTVVTYINALFYSVGGKNYVIWHNISGDMRLAEEAVSIRFPNAKHCDLSEFENFVEKAIIDTNTD